MGGSKKAVNSLVDKLKPLTGNSRFRLPANVEAAKNVILSNAAEFLTGDSIILIDDFERHSDKITSRDILGILLRLKEEKNCQIFVIMNEKFSNDGDAELFKFTKEKVFDAEFTFSPNIDEAIRIGLDDSIRSPELVKLIEDLSIVNIRTIFKISKKIIDLIRLAELTKKNITNGLMIKIMKSTALIVWCHLERRIPIEYIENLKDGDAWAKYFKDVKLVDPERSYLELIERTDYKYTDDLNKIVLDYVIHGTIDMGLFSKSICDFNGSHENRRIMENVRKNWQLYHNSFRDNADVIADSFMKDYSAAMEIVDIGMLDSGIWLLRELGRGNLADDLISRFFSRENSVPSFQDYPFTGDLKDAEFRDAWREHIAPERDQRTLKETIESLVDQGGSLVANVARLSVFTEDDLYNFFETYESQSLHAIIVKLLELGNYSIALSTDAAAAISERVKAALQRLSNASTLNRLRLGRYMKAPPAAG